MDSIRPATHAGSWYSSNKKALMSSMNQWIKTPLQTGNRARIVVSPHAGYTYCGKVLGQAYSKLNIDENTETIYVLGPSHHVYFQNKVLLSSFDFVETPLGNIPVDRSKIHAWKTKYPHFFEEMDEDTECEEHSLEMQFSPVKFLLEAHKNTKAKIVPMLISHNTEKIDYELGDILGKEMGKSKNTVFVVSSDFCHWGARFRYTAYVANESDLWHHFESNIELGNLNKKNLDALETPIYKSIEIMDKGAMKVLEEHSGKDAYKNFKKYIKVTGDTICGEKPLCVVLAALRKQKTVFHWSGYEQSSRCTSVTDSSVSYGAGYCKI